MASWGFFPEMRLGGPAQPCCFHIVSAWFPHGYFRLWPAICIPPLFRIALSKISRTKHCGNVVSTKAGQAGQPGLAGPPGPSGVCVGAFLLPVVDLSQKITRPILREVLQRATKAFPHGFHIVIQSVFVIFRMASASIFSRFRRSCRQ